MSKSDLNREAHNGNVEPLLPVEKKLIGWSLGLGIVMLVILIGLNHLFPTKL